MSVPALWIEIDGKLRKPTLDEINTYAWNEWHARIATQEFLVAVRDLGRRADEVLPPWWCPLCAATDPKQTCRPPTPGAAEDQ